MADATEVPGICTKHAFNTGVASRDARVGFFPGHESSTGCARSYPIERDTNHLCQIRPAIGLREEQNARIKPSIVYDRTFGISRGVQYLDVWPALQHLIRKFPAVLAAGHDYVGEQKVTCNSLVDKRRFWRKAEIRQSNLSPCGKRQRHPFLLNWAG
jgi:hypothetical protein